MTNLFVVLIAAFAAFSIWLLVRIVNRRERWATWTAVGLLFLVIGYPVSFGPVCWWMATADGAEEPTLVPLAYWPLGIAAAYGPDIVYKPLHWWMRVGASRGRTIHVPTNSSNSEWFGLRT